MGQARAIDAGLRAVVADLEPVRRVGLVFVQRDDAVVVAEGMESLQPAYEVEVDAVGRFAVGVPHVLVDFGARQRLRLGESGIDAAPHAEDAALGVVQRGGIDRGEQRDAVPLRVTLPEPDGPGVVGLDRLVQDAVQIAGVGDDEVVDEELSSRADVDRPTATAARRIRGRFPRYGGRLRARRSRRG